MRFYFESYGCTMNQGEARLMEDILEENGHKIVNDLEDSDALVLVTCTVIKTTELRMKRRLKAFSVTKKPVIVAGCMASVQKDQILAENPNALMLRPQDFREIGEIADSLSIKRQKAEEKLISKTSTHKTADAIIPISSGCLGTCTYCITRLARGKLRSCSPDMIVEGVRKALFKGYKEIRLTAQDTAAYGVDLDTTLPLLLKRIEALGGEFRVRVGMMNPDTAMPILRDLIEAYKAPRVYKFLHLPVQSGSEKILKMMRRKYSIDDFLGIIGLFRKNFPDITISTDLIVGFPGESEDDFRKSIKLVKKLKPNILNVTRFSPRPNTEAIHMNDKVHGRVAKNRSRELAAIHEDISSKINSTFVGKKEHILITEHGKSGTMMGRTESYKPVVVEEEVRICEFLDIEITDSTGVSCRPASTTSTNTSKAMRCLTPAEFS